MSFFERINRIIIKSKEIVLKYETFRYEKKTHYFVTVCYFESTAWKASYKMKIIAFHDNVFRSERKKIFSV